MVLVDVRVSWSNWAGTPNPLFTRVAFILYVIYNSIINAYHFKSHTRLATMLTPATKPAKVEEHGNINLLPSTTCGPVFTPKLAGGNKASLGQFPWMALIIKDTPSKTH